MKSMFDVVIIGGSYSGLSAALALGRSLRNVLIIDGNSPCNKQTPHSHNFLTHDGATPKSISDIGKSQVLAYESVDFVEDFVTKAIKTDNTFKIRTASKKTFFSKKIIIATGIKDIMPSIKGFSECWGKSVVHCPYCHGYEIKGKKTGLIANADIALHLAPLISNLTSKLDILTMGKPKFESDAILKFKNNNISIIEKPIVEIEHQQGVVTNVVFDDQTKMDYEALYAPLPFEQHSSVPEQLGCKLNELGYIEVDMFNKTTVDGVFACGDNSSRMRSVANAVASGNLAGAVVNMELSQELF
ncbi:NAD(P)/FAD-dependent oxidoreductase [Tamlana crocina]|uniref:NAD(P)/FAD-dependent oxidoreductase n=1 Tax=Tamlana crocina TaxID=393006 RepID=A0ABX1D6Z2_9FLAO|nr:NAD(P)/FAD-dependent oxidoreductase [Tamlana crocina]NJX14079.1 NAD(P)/FAD-dependent oxidoreductase [Tamlana crocina]